MAGPPPHSGEVSGLEFTKLKLVHTLMSEQGGLKRKQDTTDTFPPSTAQKQKAPVVTQVGSELRIGREEMLTGTPEGSGGERHPHEAGYPGPGQGGTTGECGKRAVEIDQQGLPY